jgi:hypothetical protein
MRKIQDYLDAAIEKQELGSDRQLSLLMDISQSSVTFWRTGKSLPSDKLMVQLAELAGITPEQALLELSYWKADAEEVKSVYRSLMQKTAGALAALLFAFSLNTSTAYARNIEGVQTQGKLTEVYIITQLLVLFRRFKSRFEALLFSQNFNPIALMS